MFNEEELNTLTRQNNNIQNGYANDSQEFSMQSIEEKLGTFSSGNTEKDEVNPDLRPSDSTLKMSFARNYQPSGSVASKVNTKQKIAIASYVAVVLALVLAIAFSAVAVNSAFKTSLQLTDDVVGASRELEQYASLITEDDYATLVNRAAELGYYDISLANTEMFVGLPVRPAQNFNVQTNWFDSLCDWISGAFGE